MSAPTRWLVLVLGSSAAAVAAASAATGDARSMVPLLWFLAVIPGLPFVRMVRPGQEPIALWIGSVALSLALTATVAEVMLYTETYTGARAVTVLAVIASAGAVLGRLRSTPEMPEPADARFGAFDGRQSDTETPRSEPVVGAEPA